MARGWSVRSFFRRSQQDRVQTDELEDSAATSSPSVPKTVPTPTTEAARVVEESPETKGFGDITDGSSNTLVFGEQVAVEEPSTEAFDEADATFGRRTEIRDTEPAKAPDPESPPDEIHQGSDTPAEESALSSVGSVGFVPPESPPTPPGVPIPYPNTARLEEEEELQQVVEAAPAFEKEEEELQQVVEADTGPREFGASAFGRGASNDAVETADLAAGGTGSTDPGPVRDNSPATDPALMDLSPPDAADIGQEPTADFQDPAGDPLDDPFEAEHPDDALVFEDNAGIEETFDEPTGDLDMDLG